MPSSSSIVTGDIARKRRTRGRAAPTPQKVTTTARNGRTVLATAPQDRAYHTIIRCAPASTSKSQREKRGLNAHTVDMVPWNMYAASVLAMHPMCVKSCVCTGGTPVHFVSQVRIVGETPEGPPLRLADAHSASTDMHNGVWQVDSTGVHWRLAYVVKDPPLHNTSRRAREWRVRMPMLEDLTTPEFVHTGKIRVITSRTRYSTALRAAIVADDLQRAHARTLCFTNFAVRGEMQVVSMYSPSTCGVMRNTTLTTFWRVQYANAVEHSDEARQTTRVHQAPQRATQTPTPRVQQAPQRATQTSTHVNACNGTTHQQALAPIRTPSYDVAREILRRAINDIVGTPPLISVGSPLILAQHVLEKNTTTESACSTLQELEVAKTLRVNPELEQAMYSAVYADAPHMPFHNDAPCAF